MNTDIGNLLQAVRRLPLHQGATETGVPGVTAWCFTTKRMEMPQIDGPYLYVVLAGSLRLYTPSGILDYVAGQYSISKIDTPLSGTVLTFSDQGDFLALSIAFTVHAGINAILALDDDWTEKILAGRLSDAEMAAGDACVLQTIYRLFTQLRQPLGSTFLGQTLLQELIYYMLCGTSGQQFLQSMAQISQADTIYQANSWIKENFRRPFTVEELAEQQNMSVSLFHQKFKAAVGMGPLQCQKRLRLTEARRLMLDEHKNVTEAAGEVGYESLSQFIRDYRKIFGAAPKEDILSMQRQLEK